MEYKTYRFLMDILEEKENDLYDQYFVSCNLFAEGLSHKSNNQMYDNLRMKASELIRIKKDLNDSVKLIYKNHPDAEMRKFWGVG